MSFAEELRRSPTLGVVFEERGEPSSPGGLIPIHRRLPIDMKFQGHGDYMMFTSMTDIVILVELNGTKRVVKHRWKELPCKISEIWDI